MYLDAVLHPKLDRLDFKQEGWRLEHEVPTGRYNTKSAQSGLLIPMVQNRYNYTNSVQGRCIQRDERTNSKLLIKKW